MSQTTATATFVFSDVEGSTRLLQADQADYGRLLGQHRELIRSAVELAGGRLFGSEGDALFAAFPSAAGALLAAADAQRALAAHPWPAGRELRVRMGVHTGEVAQAGDDYVGLPLHQVARITAAAHGGQVIVSSATRQLATPLPDGLELRDLGEHRLKDLARPERLYQLAGPGLAAEFPPLRTLSARPNNLPLQLTSFVGRDELAAARRALDGTRLLTLSGPGGTGKTRLALQLAAEASDEFPDGVYFVALETLREPELLASVVAAALGLADTPGMLPLTRLVEHLRERRVLIVLDNFEQVVEAAPTVVQLLRELPEAKAIVTSRNVLRVSGEQEFPVPPLGLPADGHAGGTAQVTAEAAATSEAVRLFAERAMAVQPAFRLTDENAPSVVDIVRRLDGLPLAIELAAARTRILPIEAIRSRLDQRLGLLTGGGRDLPARQQTLRGAIDWSYELLDEPERRLFERFSVFAGGAFLAQAEEVCGPAIEIGLDVLDGLGLLAEKSLMRATLTRDEDPRFAMLVTIREYAREKLELSGDLDALERRHGEGYRDLAESVADLLTGTSGGHWLDRLEHDHENIRAVFDWALAHEQTETALRLLAAIWRFWQLRGHLFIGRDLAERVTAMSGVPEQPPLLQTRALAAAGGICYWQGDFPRTHHFYSKALELARASGDRAALAEALYNFSFAPSPEAGTDQKALYRQGRPTLEQSLAIYRELGDQRGIANTSWGLAMAAASDGDFEGALRHSAESLELYRAQDDLFGTAWAAHQLALYLALLDRLDEAKAYLREAMELFVKSGDQSGLVLGLVDYTWLADRAGQQERAWRIGGAVQKLSETTGVGLGDAAMSFLDWHPPVAPIGDEEGMRIWNEGREMPIEDAIALAMELSGSL